MLTISNNLPPDLDAHFAHGESDSLLFRGFNFMKEKRHHNRQKLSTEQLNLILINAGSLWRILEIIEIYKKKDNS